MKTIDFEKAIEAIGCELLRIKFREKSGGNVIAAYGQVPGSLTYIMWEIGRAHV